MRSFGLSRRFWRRCVIVFALPAVLVMTACVVNGQPHVQPLRAVYVTPVRAVVAPQPVSPLPNNTISAPLLYHRWRLISASYRHVDVPTTGLDGAEISFEPTRIGLRDFNCASEWYGIDYFEGDHYHLNVAVNAASRCRGNPSEPDATVFRLLQETDTFDIHGAALVLSGPEVIIRLSLNDTPYADPGYEASFELAPPVSLQELVNNAPLIVIATVGPVTRYWDNCGYVDGALMDCAAGPGGFPATDFVLNVEQVIRDDGRIARDEPVLISQMGYANEYMRGISELAGFPISYTGDQYLFLLAPNPDNRTYGYYGPYGRLIIDGETLRLSIGNQEPLHFGDDPPVTVSELMQLAQSTTATGSWRAPTPTPGAGHAPAPPASTPKGETSTPAPEPPSIYPRSLDELVRVAALIFIGTVGPVNRYVEVSVADAIVEQGASPIVSGVPLPASDWQLEVELLLRDDGSVTRGDPIILRQVGMSQEAYAWLEKQGGGYSGRRYVFLLTPNPGGETYRTHYSIWSQLEIDGNTLRLSNETRPPLQIPISGESGPITLEQLVEFVKQQ